MAKKAAARPKKTKKKPEPAVGISALTVAGYKSIRDEQTIDIAPLTILAGANSSGKSSMMQPLLLLKQTLEAPYDPGALLLNGPNVRFTKAKQIFSNVAEGGRSEQFRVGVHLTDGGGVTSAFRIGEEDPIEVFETSDGSCTLCLDRAFEQPQPSILQLFAESLEKQFGERWIERVNWQIYRDRCFLLGVPSIGDTSLPFCFPRDLGASIADHARAVIHVPGLRGNPKRTYPLTAVGDAFPGTFGDYVASIVAHWERSGDPKIGQVNEDLVTLGLTSRVTASKIGDTNVELSVGRLPSPPAGGRDDTVNIADVGFGVSQVLPVVVALHAAKDGQLVYVEQPELHLHPRAQCRLAEVLAAAAKRGVRVVAETHSALLLLAIQALVADGNLPAAMVKLHWFQRGKDGSSTITSASLDESGAFGDWPEDFADVELRLEASYLDAVESRHAEA